MQLEQYLYALPHPVATAFVFEIFSVCCKHAGLIDLEKVAG